MIICAGDSSVGKVYDVYFDYDGVNDAELEDNNYVRVRATSRIEAMSKAHRLMLEILKPEVWSKYSYKKTEQLH